MKKAVEFTIPGSIKEAKDIQETLRRRVILQDALSSPVNSFISMDVSTLKVGQELYAVVLRFSYPELQLQEESSYNGKALFPYIPGLLAFREAPPLLKALEKIKGDYDLLLVEGQGLAHPRRFGIASHLGVIMDMPAIGCAKSLLWGKHEGVGNEVGSYSYLLDGDEVIGMALRTRMGARPIYVSQGHKVSLNTVRDFVLSLLRGYRIPEPLRWAHLKSNRLRLDNQPSLFSEYGV